MADYFINIFLDEEKLAKVEEAGLADQIKEIQGKKAIQVAAREKDQKKLVKTYKVNFEANQTTLPKEGEDMLFDMIIENRTLDIMKVFIAKAHKPLEGKEIRTRVFST